MSSSSHSFLSELDCCSDFVIVALKEYNKSNNQTMIPFTELLVYCIVAKNKLYQMTLTNRTIPCWSTLKVICEQLKTPIILIIPKPKN